MKKLVLSLAAMLSCLAANADTNPTVTIKYDGTSATITIPSEASSYVTCTSGSSSHVKIEKSSTNSPAVATMVSSTSRVSTRPRSSSMV